MPLGNRLKGAEVTTNAYSNDAYPENQLTQKIIGCAIKVHRELGPGYVESIYENAMVHELGKHGLACVRQKTVRVYYDGIEVGEHRVDILVEGKVLLELKSVEELGDKHLAQVISTLRAVGVQIGLLINFNETRVTEGIRRVDLTHGRNVASASSASQRPAFD